MRMDAGSRLERRARRLAAGARHPGEPTVLERAALRAVGSHLTRRQAIGAAAAGSLALAAGRPPRASGQVQPSCPPPNFPNDTQVCPYTKNGVSGWICCRQDQVCCSKQPLVGDAAAGCCEPGQTCCYSAKLGYYGCCGCPIGLHQCGTEPMTSQCCKRDEVCDVVDFVCRPGDECPNVLCDGACCEPGEQCAGGNCCQASKSCGGTCCGRGMICDQNTCKRLVDYKRPPRRETPKNDRLDSPPLQTFDADVAAELNYTASDRRRKQRRSERSPLPRRPRAGEAARAPAAGGARAAHETCQAPASARKAHLGAADPHLPRSLRTTDRRDRATDDPPAEAASLTLRLVPSRGRS